MNEKFKILIVDDTKFARNVLNKLIAQRPPYVYYDYEVKEVSNGKDALEAVRGDKYDIMLLDVNMPGLSGYDVVRVIKEQKISINIVIITGDTKVKLNSFGSKNVKALFYKPFNTDLLWDELLEISEELVWNSGDYRINFLGEKFNEADDFESKPVIVNNNREEKEVVNVNVDKKVSSEEKSTLIKEEYKEEKLTYNKGNLKSVNEHPSRNEVIEKKSDKKTKELNQIKNSNGVVKGKEVSVATQEKTLSCENKNNKLSRIKNLKEKINESSSDNEMPQNKSQRSLKETNITKPSSNSESENKVKNREVSKSAPERPVNRTDNNTENTYSKKKDIPKVNKVATNSLPNQNVKSLNNKGDLLSGLNGDFLKDFEEALSDDDNYIKQVDENDLILKKDDDLDFDIEFDVEKVERSKNDNYALDVELDNRKRVSSKDEMIFLLSDDDLEDIDDLIEVDIDYDGDIDIMSEDTEIEENNNENIMNKRRSLVERFY